MRYNGACPQKLCMSYDGVPYIPFSLQVLAWLGDSFGYKHLLVTEQLCLHNEIGLVNH